MAHPLFGWAGVDVVGKSSLFSRPRTFEEVVDWFFVRNESGRPLCGIVVYDVEIIFRSERPGGVWVDVTFHAGENKIA